MRADARRRRAAGTMRHARYERPSATLRRTLKRRRSSMYEASGCASVTSASSAFSAALPSTAISSSCKPAPLCSDGCGAAAVHSVCRGGCGQWSVNAQMTKGCARPPHRPRPYRQEHLRARAYAPKLPAPVAACNMRQETDGMPNATCNMQRTTSIHTPTILCVADDARSVPCGELHELRDG